MKYNTLQSTEACAGCGMREICDLGVISAPNNSTITCEALMKAIKEYGGKDKFLKDMYEKLTEANKEQKIENNQEFSMEILNEGIERLGKI